MDWLEFQALLDKAFERPPELREWIALSLSHRQDEIDKMILEALTEDAKKWPAKEDSFKGFSDTDLPEMAE